MTLAPRQDESQPLFDVARELPPGSYQLGARVLDPVRRTLQTRREAPLIAGLKELGEYGIANVGAEEVSLEAKMWLGAAGLARCRSCRWALTARSLSRPGETLSLDPLAPARPSAARSIRARILSDQVTKHE